MAEPRHLSLPARRRDPQDPARWLCTWCQGPVARPRISWCSDACVHEYRVRSDSTYAAWCVLERDRGRCAICRLDTVRLHELVRDVMPDRITTLGPGSGIANRIDHVVAVAYCCGCGARAGTMRVYFRTLFGLEEDAAVLGDGRRCRVY